MFLPMTTAYIFILAMSPLRSLACVDSWCEAGDQECVWDLAPKMTQSLFSTSITSEDAGHRRFPYWHPVGQGALGVANEAVTLAVVVQHGANRNGGDYCSYVANNAAAVLNHTLVIGPQVYFPGDGGLDEDVHIW